MYDLKVNYAFMPHNRGATNQLLAILAKSAQFAPGENYNASRDDSG